MQMFSLHCGNFNRSGEYRKAFHQDSVRHPLLFVQRHGNHHSRGLKRPPERPTPTCPCWLSLSKARLKRENLPAAQRQLRLTGDNGDGNLRVETNVLLLFCLMAA